jgi:hypothetical protein
VEIPYLLMSLTLPLVQHQHEQGGLLKAQFDIFELVAEFRRFRMSIVQVRTLCFPTCGTAIYGSTHA